MNTQGIKMLEGSLYKNIFIFSLPLMFSNMLQVLFNMSDIAVAGHFAGPAASRRPEIPADSRSFGAVYLHRHILRHKVGFHGVFQRLMNDDVVVDHRTGLERPQLFRIK